MGEGDILSLILAGRQTYNAIEQSIIWLYEKRWQGGINFEKRSVAQNCGGTHYHMHTDRLYRTIATANYPNCDNPPNGLAYTDTLSNSLTGITGNISNIIAGGHALRFERAFSSN
jgi:hypothetical protein